MASFEKAQALVSIAEGGYSKDENDSGNYNNFDKNTPFVGTNFGISAPTLTAWLGRTATKSDMLALTYDEALKIYKKNYWNVINGDNINSQSLANLLYDSAVNQGIGKPKIIVQNTLNIPVTLPFSKNVTDTINNYKNQEELFNKLKAERIATYAGGDPRYYQAWIDRVKGILYDATIDTIKFTKKNIVPIIISVSLLTIVVLGIIYKRSLIKTVSKTI
jgi:lysozyme family protein